MPEQQATNHTQSRKRSNPTRGIESPEAHEVLVWLLEGHDDQQITEAITEKFPTLDPASTLALIREHLKSVSQTDPDMIRGFCLEAFRELYRRMVSIGDYANAMRTLHEILKAVKVSASSPKLTYASPKDHFIAEISRGRQFVLACENSGLSQQQVVDELQADPTFLSRIQAAQTFATATIEAALFDAAASGNVTAIKEYLDHDGSDIEIRQLDTAASHQLEDGATRRA